ncbi:hypothetical protein [Spiroplasma culicicola]|uniref:Transmembrane protein n=1 Tax=Spiroplasma culicicola AES-1 TaxID=1276246 RepID=W6AFM3_9MOLU|nr:hypothetical protein [Spiroplasma culicicola]AHI52494.1 hypothetical protein SCULI_v1c01530 [Spiroplasma culicicola AES-1]
MEKEFRSFEEINGSNVNEKRENEIVKKYKGLLIANLVLNFVPILLFIILGILIPYIALYLVPMLVIIVPIIIISGLLIKDPKNKNLVIALYFLLTFYNWISLILITIYGYKLDF